MKVEISERVKTNLSALDRDDRERVNTWFHYLERWEEEPFAKAHSAPLSVQGETVYLFRTSTDVRIFYKVDREERTIVILDVSNKDTILSSGSVTGGVG